MKNLIYDRIPNLEVNLNKVSDVINIQLNTSEVVFTDTVKQMFNKNSKMVRPALVLISSMYQKKVIKQAIDLAAAVELFHVATLIHDDIIDEAKLRRNQKTIHEKYDVGFAVICGDYLFSKAFQLVFETQDLNSISLMGNNITKIVFGEVEQYLDKYNEDISITRYLDVIEKKTASFFATSLVLGGRLAKAPQAELNTLEKFGTALGMIFQIQDDLLDFENESTIGKSSMSDIKRGTYSLPIIIALSKSLEFKNYITTTEEDYDFKYIVDQLHHTNALAETQQYLDDYYSKCQDYLNQLRNDEVRTNLASLVSTLIIRKS